MKFTIADIKKSFLLLNESNENTKTTFRFNVSYIAQLDVLWEAAKNLAKREDKPNNVRFMKSVYDLKNSFPTYVKNNNNKNGNSDSTSIADFAIFFTDGLKDVADIEFELTEKNGKFIQEYTEVFTALKICNSEIGVHSNFMGLFAKGEPEKIYRVYMDDYRNTYKNSSGDTEKYFWEPDLFKSFILKAYKNLAKSKMPIEDKKEYFSFAIGNFNHYYLPKKNLTSIAKLALETIHVETGDLQAACDFIVNNGPAPRGLVGQSFYNVASKVIIQDYKAKVITSSDSEDKEKVVDNYYTQGSEIPPYVSERYKEDVIFDSNFQDFHPATVNRMDAVQKSLGFFIRDYIKEKNPEIKVSVDSREEPGTYNRIVCTATVTYDSLNSLIDFKPEMDNLKANVSKVIAPLLFKVLDECGDVSKFTGSLGRSELLAKEGLIKYREYLQQREAYFLMGKVTEVVEKNNVDNDDLNNDGFRFKM